MATAETGKAPGADETRFFVARNRLGHWIVRDREGLIGGTFTERAAAVHFAMGESILHHDGVCCLPDTIVVNDDPALDKAPLYQP